MMTGAYAGLPRTKEVVDLLNRHRDYYVALAESAELSGPNVPRWRDVVADEAANLRMAVEWSLETDVEAGLRIVGTVGRESPLAAWDPVMLDELEAKSTAAPAELRASALLVMAEMQRNYGDLDQAETLVDEAVRLLEGGPPAVLARALVVQASVALFKGGWDYSPGSTAVTALTRALELARAAGDRLVEALSLHWLYRPADSLQIFRELGDDHWIAWACWSLGVASALAGDFDEARAYGRESVAAARASREPYAVANHTHGLGDIELIAGDYDAAARHYHDALALARRHGVAVLAAQSLTSLALCAAYRGHAEDAIRWLRACVREAAAAGKPATALLIGAVDGLAASAAHDGNAERAARLFGAAAAQYKSVGRPPIEDQLGGYESDPRLGVELIRDGRASARTTLGDDAYERAHAAGAALSRDEIVREALAEA